MSKVLYYTLVADGSSDACLKRIIDWTLLSEAAPSVSAVNGSAADFRMLPNPPRDLPDRIALACQLFPCDLMFVHRDAEADDPRHRLLEIRRAIPSHMGLRHVPLVPVRMTEAWLLIDEAAIRRAADNPNGTISLDMPRKSELEHIADPKDMLRHLLITASGKSGRNRRRFMKRIPERVHRVADLIEDFSPLCGLPAFSAFRDSTREALRELYSTR